MNVGRKDDGRRRKSMGGFTGFRLGSAWVVVVMFWDVVGTIGSVGTTGE